MAVVSKTLGFENLDPSTYMKSGGAYSTGDMTFLDSDCNDVGDERYLTPLKSSCILRGVHITTAGADFSSGTTTTFTLGLRVGRQSAKDEGMRGLRYTDVPNGFTIFTAERMFNGTTFTNRSVYSADASTHLWELCGYDSDPECLFYPRIYCDSTDLLSSLATPTLEIIFGVEI